MSSYLIIDEPQVKFSENLIVNPLMILFVSIIAPMFFNIPFLGKLWLPFLWLSFNGYILGSATFKKEILVVILGSATYMGMFFLAMYVSNYSALLKDPQVIWPYVRISLQAIFFITLYIGVFMQSKSFSIYEYVKESR